MNKRFPLACAMGLLLVAPLAAAPPPTKSGLDLSGMDTSVSPSDDFYLYADGNWLKKNPVPGDKPRWGTFNILADHNQDILREILQGLATQKAAPGSIEQKLGDFYSTAMDEVKINAAGVGVLKPELDRIEAVKDAAGLQGEIAHLHGLEVNVFFGFGSDQDAKDSSKVIGEASQGGLGLPDRDYYFRDDDKSKSLREAYQKHVGKMLQLLGRSVSQAESEADAILKLETRMARAQLTRVQMRDPEATYHPTDLAGLAALTPHFDWPGYFKRLGAPVMTSINMGTPEYFKELDKVLSEVSLEDLKAYLRWHLIHGLSQHLSDAVEDESFSFYGKALTGTPANLPRWRREVHTIDVLLGEALGQKYVEKAFPPESKARVLQMVNNLRATLRHEIETLTWMGPSTKQAALAKLDAFRAKIGYPDRWRDYSALNIDRQSYLGNVLRAEAFEVQRDLAKIGKPVDREEWGMTPPTVNAYYNPQMNEIVFPAGVMQPPFFQADAEDAVNYGGLGMVIGHEMTHGFDDQGRQFDPQGNLKNWWTPEDLANFQKLASGVEKQFSSYTVADGLHINGKLVLGEAIADIGGLKLAYLSYQKSLEGKPHLSLDGFTPEQRFFLGYARIWAMNMRPEYERLQVNTDPHPNARYRVIGPCSDMVEFAKDFNCPDDCPMVRPASERNQIW